MVVSNGSIFTEDCSDILVTNKSFVDEDFVDISDWVDEDAGTGVSSQVTFDSKSCLKLLSGDNVAQRSRDVGSFSARVCLLLDLYCDVLGLRNNTDFFSIQVQDAGSQIYLTFGSDGLHVYDGAAHNEVGTDIVVQDTWQRWVLDINLAADTLDIYLDGVLQGSGIDCSWFGAFTDGKIVLAQFGQTTSDRLSYVDCIEIGDNWEWIDGDSGTNAESSQETFDSQSCFKFDSGNAASGNLAFRHQDVGSLQNRTTATFSLYHSALGTMADADYFVVSFRRTGVACSIAFATDGVFIYDGASWNEVGTDEVSIGVWQEWTIDIDFTTPALATVDIYLGGVLIGNDVDCSWTGSFTEGQIQLLQYGYNTANRITYVDWVEVGNDLASDVNVDPGPVGLTTSLTGEATAEGDVDVDPGPVFLTAIPTGISPENDSVITLTTSLEGVVLSAHIDCDSIPLAISVTGYRLECDPIVVTISVEGQSADITVLPDPIEVAISLHGDYSEFITTTPIEVTLGLTGGYAHEYVVIANPIEIGTTLTADWPNVLVSPGPISLTTRLLGEGVITDKAEIILYFYSNGQLITTKTIPLTPALTGQEWLRTRFPIELKGRHLSIKVECTGSNRETYLYDYGLDLRILNER